MGKNSDSQEQDGSEWDRAFEAVRQARQTNTKVDLKEFERLTKSAGGKS